MREGNEEASKLAAESGREEADNAEKMGELSLASERQKQALMDSFHRVSIQERLAEEVAFANQDFAIKQAAMEREIANLDKHAKDYEVKLKAAQDREKQLIQAHENEVTAIKDKAEIERNQRILSAEDQLRDTIASGLTQVLMGHQTFAKMMESLGDQVASSLLKNALASKHANEESRQSEAASAARKAFLTGESIPIIGPVMGPVFGAAAYTAMMAFQEGGIVPGVGRGDIVPAMLEPGEGIVRNSAMDRLNRGEMGNTTHNHITVKPTYHLQALDTAGMERVLDKHSDTLQRHVEGAMRKANR